MFAVSAIRAWGALWFLALETQQVIWLRTLRLAAGGAAAEREALRMVTEKVIAAHHTARRVALGGSPQAAVRHYRGRVRANRRRLLGQ
jgi:hypothetical protein